MSDTTPSDADVLYSQPANPERYHVAARATLERDIRENEVLPEVDAKAAAHAELDFAYRYQVGDADQIAHAIADAKRNPPDAEKVRDWERDSMAHLRETYGEGASEALGLTKQLIAGDKALRDRLDRTGLGSHPAVVKQLAQAAWNRRPR